MENLHRKEEAPAPVIEKLKCTNLGYLISRTKSNPQLVKEMIRLYLEQTPRLILEMKKSLAGKNREALNALAHKLMPSFSIMGMSAGFENIARQIQEHPDTQMQTNAIPEMVMQLEDICRRACTELEEELLMMENTNA